MSEILDNSQESKTISLISSDEHVWQHLLQTIMNAYLTYSSVLEEINNFISHVDYINYIEESNNFNNSYLTPLIQLQEQLKSFCELVEIMRKKNKHEQCNLPTNSVDSVKKPRVTGLNDIAGLWEIKKVLKTLIMLPKQQPQLFQNRKICKTILLFGPPGTGKTLLAHAISAEAKAVFHSISVGDILSSYIGETEKNLKELFQSIKNSNKFSILFIDEIDSFCRKRNDAESDPSRRFKTEMMCQMTDIENSDNVIIICATNCPWDLDSAILRRFQKKLYIPLPNDNERLSLFKHFSKKTPLEFLEDAKWTELIDITAGFSGSDISNIFQSALDIPINELQETMVWKKTIDDFYEPANQHDDLLNVFCSDLEKLPLNSVRARALSISDVINITRNYNATISNDEIEKFDIFKKK